MRSSDNDLRAISQEIHQPPNIEISLKITQLKFHSNFIGANELKWNFEVTPGHSDDIISDDSLVLACGHYRKFSNIRRTEL